MARIRLITMTVLAVFCMSAVAAAVASAAEGEIVNKEGNALVKNKYVSEGKTTVLETAAGTKVICTSNTDHGIWTSKTGGEDTILFKGCTSGGLSCKGGKDEAGEPKAGEIFVLVGLLIKPSKALRLILYTIHTPGTLTAGELEFVCSGIKIKVKGSFLSSSNYKTKELSTTIVLVAKQKKGIQEPSEYETEAGVKVKCEGLQAKIENGAFEPAGQEGEETDTLEEAAQFL